MEVFDFTTWVGVFLINSHHRIINIAVPIVIFFAVYKFMHHIAPPVSKYFCIMRTFGDYKIEKQIFSSIRLFISTPNAEAKGKLQKDFIHIALPVALGLLPNNKRLFLQTHLFTEKLLEEIDIVYQPVEWGEIPCPKLSSYIAQFCSDVSRIVKIIYQLKAIKRPTITNRKWYKFIWTTIARN